MTFRNNLEKNNLKKILVFLLLLFVAGTSLWLYLFFHTPRMTVARALKNSFNEDALGFSFPDARALTESGSYTGTADITLSRLNLPENLTNELPFDPVHLEGLGLATSYRMNADEPTYVSETEVSYLMKPYIRLENYADKDTLALRLPELFDSWLSVNPQTLGSDYNASLLSEISGVTLPEDFSFSLFAESSSEPLSIIERRELLNKRFREAEVLRLEDKNTYEINFVQQESNISSSSKTRLPNSSIEKMLLTLNEKEKIETLTCHFTLPFDGENYPAVLTLSPNNTVKNNLSGELCILPTAAESTDISLLTLTFSTNLLQENSTHFTFDFEELTFARNQTQVTLYGKIILSDKEAQSPSLPVYDKEASLELFSLELKDFAKLGKEILTNLDKSELRILKGLLP